jgi:hypothetical protein
VILSKEADVDGNAVHAVERRRGLKMGQTIWIGGRLLLLGAVALLDGCTSFGSWILTGERLNYNVALQITDDEQLLLNLVRLRYLDSTAFVEVGSITAQSSFQSGLEGGRQAASVGNAAAFFGIAGSLSYSTQPTLVYAPLQGEDFIRRLLSPLTLERLVLLYHSGWGIQRLFSLCVKEINEIENTSRAPHPRPERAAEIRKFARVVALLGDLDARDGIDLLAEPQPEGAAPQYVLHVAADVMGSPEARELAELLGLQPGQAYYRLAYPFAEPGKSPSRDTVYVETRSVLGIMSFLSRRVDVPKQDRDSGRVDGALHEMSESSEGQKRPGLSFSIKSQSSRPDHAAVAVRYRDSWFYIDDADLKSKGTFSLLTQIFALQASAIPVTPPVLTLPVGR